MGIICTDHVRYENVIQKIQGGNEYPATIRRRKANCIGRNLRRNCLLKHVTEVKTGTGRRGRRCKQLLHDVKETRRSYVRPGELAVDL